MIDLVAHLNSTDAPDRDLDCGIYISLGGKPPTDIDPLYWTAPGGLIRHYESLVPRYTGSFDAAVTLLPEGVNVIDLVLSWDTAAEHGHPACSIRWYEPGKDGHAWQALSVSAKTIPLTVCLAAMTLRSRASFKIDNPNSGPLDKCPPPIAASLSSPGADVSGVSATAPGSSGSD